MQERCITAWSLAVQPLRRLLHIAAVLLLSAAFIAPLPAIAAPDSALRISIDFPYFGNEKKLTQDVFFSAPVKLSGTLTFNCFRYTSPTDSLFVYGQKNAAVKLAAGVSSIPLHFGPNDANSFVLSPFYDILRRYAIVPAGAYRVYLSFTPDSLSAAVVTTASPATAAIGIHRDFRLQADSTLPATSSLSKQISGTMIPERQRKKGFFGLAGAAAASSVAPAAKTLERSTGRLNRLARSRGLSQQTVQHGNTSLVNLWYEDWFVGRYELDGTQPASAQIAAREARLNNNIASGTGSELGSYRSLASQVRELAKSNGEDNELQGEIALGGSFSNGQPEYSAGDNNYYEVRGRAETEVADIPISIEGYYTTQDAHRTVKGSYIRVHYDAERAKAKLMKLITGYRSQFSQTISKGKGLDQVYGSYLSNLQGSREKMLADLKREAGLPASGGNINTDNLREQIEASLAKKMQDTAGLATGAEGKLDSAGRLKRSEERAAKVSDSAARLYARAMKKYEQVQAAEAQLQKYQSLLSQYKNTTYFDSALAYNKVANLKSGDETTYKQMAKSAAGLLPEGKAKTFMAGLTSLDAGIINHYTSRYTAAGQQLKGIDAGYDIGFARIGLSAGSTEYAGRDGRLDKYTTYSGRILFSPAKGQKAGLVYYGYTPSKSLTGSDGFFKNADLSMPSFRAPVHIVSATFEGIIAKDVTVDAEAATSFRNGSGQSFQSAFDADRTAWHLNAEGRIPQTTLSLSGGYEHGGRVFQNSTLPLTIAGTDLYKAGVKGEFFHAFLTAGLEYNHMQQQNFYSTGGNSRWGFEIATHSKQYPSVALSYKPFATFRALSDTLAVPQRSLQGAVWSGRASYQIKRRGGVSYRFSAVFNRSTSHSDSVSYGADLLQLNAIYTDKRWMVLASGGQSLLSTGTGSSSGTTGGTTDTLNPAHVRTTFGMGSVSYSFSKSISVNGGADIGFAPFGLSKWGFNGGLSYRLKPTPLTARLSGRYSSYRLAAYSGMVSSIDGSTYGNDKSDPMSWRQLLSGNIELIWQFRMKMKG